MERSWIQCYFEFLEFFYWEPQHLGRKKYKEAKLDSIKKVRDHLKLMEVTLNHSLDQFFSLAPVRLRNAFFEQVFEETFADDFVLHGSGVESQYGLSNSTQPDLFFVSPSSVASIELKVKAKSSIEQVLKYALLGAAEEAKSGNAKQHFLAFIAPDAASLWKQGWSDAADVTAALQSVDTDHFLSKHPLDVKIQPERFNAIVKSLALRFVTYQQFGSFLAAARPEPGGTRDGDEVYRKLIDGILGEFGSRGLFSASASDEPSFLLDHADGDGQHERSTTVVNHIPLEDMQELWYWGVWKERTPSPFSTSVIVLCTSRAACRRYSEVQTHDQWLLAYGEAAPRSGKSDSPDDTVDDGRADASHQRGFRAVSYQDLLEALRQEQQRHSGHPLTLLINPKRGNGSIIDADALLDLDDFLAHHPGNTADA